MPDLNRANRQACDVDIRDYKTKAPFLFLDTANTTTAGLSGDKVYAKKKGVRAIPFFNPIEGTLTIEAQVYPFKLFALFSDHAIESTAIYAVHKTIKCTVAGKLSIPNAVSGSVFVYAVGDYGGTPIAGTYATDEFSATTANDLAADTNYEVGYLVSKSSNVQKVSFNLSKVPKDCFITYTTLDKDEEGSLTPFIVTAYKASIQRTFELSFSSEGDPASITLTYDLCADKDGNVLDIVEDTSELS